MFTAISRFATKFRVPVVIVWLTAAVLLFVFSPKLSDVGVTDESQFLPQDTESAEAASLINQKFITTTETTAGSGIIVIYNDGGLTETNLQSGRAIYDWLTSEAAPQGVEGVTAIYTDPALSATLVSPDNTAMMMVVALSSGSLSDTAESALTEIRGYIKQHYADQQIYFTGESGLFQDMFASVQDTVDRTTLVTVILVAVLLLIIYRSPVAILLPLLAIGCSFAVSAGLIGFLGEAGAKFSTLAEAYLVVIVFGVGTDYCLFIVSRYREELRQKERREAQNHALRHIGPVIAASALTVIAAFLSLGISRFGMNQTMGYALAIGVAITLLAGLTLVPALMSLFGKILFWPTRTSADKPATGFGWHTIGKWVSQHPAVVALPITLILMVPFLALPQLNRSADIINQLPQNSESVKGYKILTSHFQLGELSPMYAVIESSEANINSADSLQAIADVAASLEEVPGVSRVNYFGTPAAGLSALSAQFNSVAAALAQGAGLDQLSALQTAGESLQSLALQYPSIVQSPNFQQAAANLSQISGLAGQLTTANPADMPAILAQLQQAVAQTSGNLQGLAGEFRLEGSTPFTAYLMATYFSTDGTAARIDIVLAGDPNSNETLNTVATLRKAADQSVASSALAGSSVYVGGESAVRADIMLTNDADFGRVFVLTIVAILIIIIILLRSLLAPLYMVATVLLNYGATLGIATWLFLDVMKQNSMIYMIPLFIFVILIALGADYNIFLVSRIREEAQKVPIKEAVSRAVASTGGVITACGIILAGTFATLMTSPLQVVFQIGAAISIGVIIDTLIVRAMLVPALAAITKRWSWWPSRLFHQKSPEDNKI